jgi:GMP synthase-like glutamine amidotransferase
MKQKKQVLVISIMGDDEVLPKGLFDDAPEGGTDLHWMQRRLDQVGLHNDIELAYVDISQGDELPDVDTFDAVIVGGSIHNVNEDRVWQRKGIEWLTQWRETSRPLLGMCGGHQMASVALGGSVAVMDGEPNVGTEEIELTEAGRSHFLFANCTQQPKVHLGHFDHVDRPPDGSTVLAHYANINMAMDMGRNWLTVQFHPEASASLMVRGWGGKLGDLSGAYHKEHVGVQIVSNFFVGTGVVPIAN